MRFSERSYKVLRSHPWKHPPYPSHHPVLVCASRRFRMIGCMCCIVPSFDAGACGQVAAGREPLRDADGKELKPEASGRAVDIQGELLILAVGNGRQAGGGVQLCSGAGESENVTLSSVDSALLN